MKWWIWMILWLAIIVTAFIILTCSKQEEKAKYKFKLYSPNENEEKFMWLFNSYRQSQGLIELPIDVVASEKARLHTEYMIKNDTISHDNIVERREYLVSLGALNVGEIVGGKYKVIENLFTAFTKSPEHNAIILNDTVNTCGISLEQDVNGRNFVTVITFKI